MNKTIQITSSVINNKIVLNAVRGEDIYVWEYVAVPTGKTIHNPWHKAGDGLWNWYYSEDVPPLSYPETRQEFQWSKLPPLPKN